MKTPSNGEQPETARVRIAIRALANAFIAELTRIEKESLTTGDTPETDAASAGWWNHPSLPSFEAMPTTKGRTLELQRNEARAIIENINSAFGLHPDTDEETILSHINSVRSEARNYPDLQLKLEEARAERDALKAEKFNNGKDFSLLEERYANATSELTALRAEVEVFREERFAKERLIEALRADKERLLNVARGCFDYGGGYRGEPEKLEIFHHGIHTVVNALSHADDKSDTQINALERIGRSAIRSAISKGGEK